MPMRLKRFYENADLHFVTFSCYHRRSYLASSCNKDQFLSALEQVRQQYTFAVIGYVVMPEHVHLLFGKPEIANLSVVLQVLKQTTSAKLSAANNPTPGSFRQRRFCDFNVKTEHKRVEKLRYLHQNPVTRGLAEKPEDWPWSSFRHYALGEASPVRLDSSWLYINRPFVDPTFAKARRMGHPEFFPSTYKFGVGRRLGAPSRSFP